MENNESYSLEDEAALLGWASRIAAVDRRKLGAWVLSALNAEPNSRAERLNRYELAEIFLSVFLRQAAKTPTDAVLLGLITKLESMMAEGSGELDTAIAPCVSIEL